MKNSVFISTSTKYLQVALRTVDNFIFKFSKEPNMHAKLLPLFLQQILAESGLTFADVDEVFVDVGPGSFTGIRVGIAFVTGLSFGDCSIYAFNFMQIEYILSGCSVVLIEANQDEYYVANFLENIYFTLPKDQIGTLDDFSVLSLDDGKMHLDAKCLDLSCVQGMDMSWFYANIDISPIYIKNPRITK